MKTRNGRPRTERCAWGTVCAPPHPAHGAHTRHTPWSVSRVQCAHRMERDERCAELITNKRTEVPGGVGSPVHTYHSHGLTQTIRRQRPGRVEGVLSPAAMACGRWHAAWLGCLAHASAAASRSRVQASPATALGVYQRAMSSLARAPRAAASPGCSSTVRMARRSSRTEGCEGWARHAAAVSLPPMCAWARLECARRGAVSGSVPCRLAGSSADSRAGARVGAGRAGGSGRAGAPRLGLQAAASAHVRAGRSCAC